MKQESLVSPASRTLSPAAQRLLGARVGQIVEDGVPKAVTVPPSVKHYLYLTEVQDMPASLYFDSYSAQTASLLEDVESLELQISLARLEAGLEKASSELVAKDAPLEEAATAAPNWLAILQSPETLAAWQRNPEAFSEYLRGKRG